MAKGGIIMDVTTAEQAKIAENAGVCFTRTKPFQSLLNPEGITLPRIWLALFIYWI